MRRYLIFLAVATAACKPDLGDRESLVTTTRVLAVRGEPPEAAPGESVTYSLLVASPEGGSRSAASWAYCSNPKLLTDNGSVSAACQRGQPTAAAGPTATLALPDDACFRFGPEVSTAELRPRDPDPTGGFFQPIEVVVDGGDARSFGFERLACKLSGAAAEIARDHAARYRRNVAPHLSPIGILVGGAPAEEVPRGARAELTVSWPTEDAEGYVAFDPVEQRLTERREAMRVSWFTTAGTFEHDRTGRAETDFTNRTTNAWSAPDVMTTAHLFVVLRDSRGATSFVTRDVAIR